MRKRILLMIFSAFSLSHAEVKTVQHGLDGYEGCEDTYLTETGKEGDFNHGSEELIRLRGGT